MILASSLFGFIGKTGLFDLEYFSIRLPRNSVLCDK